MKARAQCYTPGPGMGLKLSSTQSCSTGSAGILGPRLSHSNGTGAMPGALSEGWSGRFSGRWEKRRRSHVSAHCDRWKLNSEFSGFPGCSRSGWAPCVLGGVWSVLSDGVWGYVAFVKASNSFKPLSREVTLMFAPPSGSTVCSWEPGNASPGDFEWDK